MNPNLLLAFWATAFLLILVPGPDWAFVLASSTRDRMVVPAVCGLMLGYLGLTVLVAAGLGAPLARSPVFLTTLTIVGACYLIYLGGSILRQPAAPQTDSRHTANSAPAPLRRLRDGIGVSGLNPKGLLIFLALLPQFTDADGPWPLPLQLAALASPPAGPSTPSSVYAPAGS
ncbi:LysE family translocator [Nocardia crassostreae]|uniref:LysE family translocator n=1 Tax=Nocardia crassostreae TaxID=53428 RepID=UPI001FDFA114|nr:LysE family translocator [Nocardia crassostreae]